MQEICLRRASVQSSWRPSKSSETGHLQLPTPEKKTLHYIVRLRLTLFRSCPHRKRRNGKFWPPNITSVAKNHPRCHTYLSELSIIELESSADVPPLVIRKVLQTQYMSHYRNCQEMTGANMVTWSFGDNLPIAPKSVL